MAGVVAHEILARRPGDQVDLVLRMEVPTHGFVRIAVRPDLEGLAFAQADEFEGRAQACLLVSILDLGIAELAEAWMCALIVGPGTAPGPPENSMWADTFLAAPAENAKHIKIRDGMRNPSIGHGLAD